MKINTDNLFIILVLIFIWIGLPILVAMDSQEQSWDDKIETDKYCAYYFIKEEDEKVIDFVKKVMDFAAEQDEIYDITYTRSKVLVKTIKICVVTHRWPEVTFNNTFDGAIIKWFKLKEHHPEKIKKFFKRYEKEKKERAKNNN